MHSGFAMLLWQLDDKLGGIMNSLWDDRQPDYDASFDQQALYMPLMRTYSSANGTPDFTDFDLDFSKFVQPGQEYTC